MELRHLRYAVAVADAGGFRRAGRVLRVAEQSLSKQVADLERELGVPLFDRLAGAHGTRLTAAGEEFVLRARQILAAVDDATAVTRQVSRLTSGRLRVGTPDWAPWTDVFRQAMSAFRRANPAATLDTDPTPWHQQLRALRERRLDVGFAVAPLPADFGSDLRWAVLGEESTLYALLAADHPLAGAAAVGAADLAALPLYLVPAEDDPALHHACVRALRAAGLAPRLAPAASSFAAAVQLAAAGTGWLLAPDSIARHCPPGLTARPLIDATLRTGVHVVWRAGDETAFGRAFVEAVCATAGNAVGRGGQTPGAAGRRVGAAMGQRLPHGRPPWPTAAED